MEHPKRVGDRTTLAVMAVFDLLGYALYVPFGENTRTDLVVDDGTGLVRVQCKTGRLRDGSVRFATCSSYAHHRAARFTYRDYAGEIDAFAVFCPQTDTVYLVPIDSVPPKRGAALRVDAPRNNQRRGIRFARDYEIGRVSAVVAQPQASRSTSGATAPSARPRMST